MSQRSLLLLLLGLLTWAPSSAHAEAVDASKGATLTLGSPKGPSPQARGDGARTGRVSGLPTELALLTRLQMHGPLDWPVAISADRIVAATSSGYLLSFQRDGAERWRVQLPSIVVAEPVITAAGDVVVTLKSGECLSFDDAGHLKFRFTLPERTFEAGVQPLVLSSGSVAVTAGTAIYVLASDGRVQASARLPEPAVGALLWDGAALVLTSWLGDVYRWQPPSAPKVIGSLGEQPSSGAALAGDQLIVPLASRRLARFHMKTQTTSVLYASDFDLDGPVAVSATGEAWLVQGHRALLSVGPERISTLNVGSLDNGPMAPLLLAQDGRVAFVRQDGFVAIATDAIELSEQRACSAPLGISADAHNIWVSCRDGTLAVFGKPR